MRRKSQARFGGGRRKSAAPAVPRRRPTLHVLAFDLDEPGECNGDNLSAINDPTIAVAYGVEAIRLVDHYDFRTVMQSATAAQPLVLQPDAANWWAPYYDPTNPRCTERTVFCRGATAPTGAPAS